MEQQMVHENIMKQLGRERNSQKKRQILPRNVFVTFSFLFSESYHYTERKEEPELYDDADYDDYDDEPAPPQSRKTHGGYDDFDDDDDAVEEILDPADYDDPDDPLINYGDPTKDDTKMRHLDGQGGSRNKIFLHKSEWSAKLKLFCFLFCCFYMRKLFDPHKNQQKD